MQRLFTAALLGLTSFPALAAEEAQPGGLASMLPLLIIVLVFYFMLIRPQMKRNKEHTQMIGDMAVGDEVVTNGGLLGKVSKMGDQFIHVTVAEGTVLRVQKQAVSSMVPKGTIKNES